MKLNYQLISILGMVERLESRPQRFPTRPDLGLTLGTLYLVLGTPLQSRKVVRVVNCYNIVLVL